MGAKASKEKKAKKNESKAKKVQALGDTKHQVTELSPKEILDIQMSWQEMHKNGLVDPDVLLFKLFFEESHSAREKYSKLMEGVNVEKMIWIRDWACAKQFRDNIQKTSNSLQDIVNSLNYSDRIIDKLHEHGKRHIQYGVTRDEIRSFCDCLLLTLRMELGTKLTQQAQSSWETMLKLVVETFCMGLRDTEEMPRMT